MNYEIFDVETTTRNKGDPYDKENSVVFWGYRTSDSDVVCSRTPRSFDVGRTLVGFNLKFDLTWAKRYGILLDNLKVWDCQLAHFLLTGQSNPYPSLNGVSEVLGLPKKLDEVKQYWASGIDTRDIPPDILTDYLKQDLLVTELVFKRQLDAFEKNPQLYKLFQLQCEDLLTLLEMEWNGLEVDVVGCKQKEQETEEQLKEIDKTLNDLFEDKPINFNSRMPSLG